MLQLLKLDGKMCLYEYIMKINREQGLRGMDAEEYQ